MFIKELSRCRKKIEKFNKALADYVKMTGDNEVPDIECTVIGTSPMEPIKIKELPNGFAYNNGGYWELVVVISEDGEYWLAGEYELDDFLSYNRRRVRKGRRVWKSNNPDRELERDED